MTTKEIREKYIKFFTDRGHVETVPSPLVLENDPTTLFTSSGMQQMIPYLKGEKHPLGTRLVDSQLSIRMQDLDEVADNRHLSSFEMLGNWSFGDYFKEDQLSWVWEFLTKEIGFDKEKLYVSVFEGNDIVPKDTESYEIWKKIGVNDTHIHYYDLKKNWWARNGMLPTNMPSGEIGGTTSEIFYDFEEVSHNPEFGSFCHPNCDCGKFLEIGNSVFMCYKKEEYGGLVALPQKNVDFGGGLERIAAALNNDPDVFQIDMFTGIIKKIETEIGVNYGTDSKKDRDFRIVADHLRTSCSLLAEGILPGNKLHGYALRRLIRRAMFHIHLLGSGISGSSVSHIAEDLRNHYPSVDKNWSFIEENLNLEATRFESALKRGLAKLTHAVSDGIKIDGKVAFDLYQNDGFPLELTMEILSQNGMNFSTEEKNLFESEFEKHKENSRSMSAGIFKGGLENKSDENITKLHTATHLLHAALRKILGEHVGQKGSHITGERLRFDFSYPQKLTDDEIKKVESLVNEKIKEDLTVTFSEMSLDEAIKIGALHFFAEKYGERVKVYSIGPKAGPEINSGRAFSREICGGPHVTHTKDVGGVNIIKQEKIGAGIVRLYASLIN
ncbi:MAG: Alanine-tRNA ligase [Candidatus Woesebacteria bacterium GW2011_GWA2_40_7]|uniref:alanine--tRNA ligase n=3 Tax=Candidatus Woeseibacteriota TaxID=1752722 RepID=A0A0G0LM02_9BACT|nr:MAG: Alanine-tRNA ligase [Candidatus Woesebacteria bacterium GW2011_GWB1_39_10]KKR72272.1 MAG: Alanine-tRNA ligase [Candidatus Woesebacteria bacterium GW2011_GWA2_40_7]KKS91037.1 MAG: Alanine-tRNA ligase [Candidatus Woesebacteria bacterium GW2011_GWA1_43_12]